MFSQHSLLDYASDYYADADLRISAVSNREFMLRTDRYSQRHLHFPSLEKARQELVRRPPYHFYSSVALYLDPAFKDTSRLEAWESGEVFHEDDCTAESWEYCECNLIIHEPGSMAKKGWMGADLFFDLDGDHLPSYNGYMDMLEKVAKDSLRLFDDFLLDDYGWTEDDIDIRFSGSRGFHFYIEDQVARAMGKEERLHLQDHILGNDLALSSILEERNRYSDKWGEERATYKLHPTDWAGWSSRFTKTMFDMAKELIPLNSKERDALVRSWWPRKTNSPQKGRYKRPHWTATDKEGNLSNPPKRANGRAVEPICHLLTDRRIVKRVATSGDLSWAFRQVGLTGVQAQKSFIEMVVQQSQLRQGCEIDPILSDIKRQHRVSGSLHLGKGMPCFSIDKDLLEDIPTLLTKSSEIIGGEMVSTRLYNDITLDLNREAHFTAGTYELPRWKALMLVCEDVKQTKKKKAGVATEAETPAAA